MQVLGRDHLAADEPAGDVGSGSSPPRRAPSGRCAASRRASPSRPAVKNVIRPSASLSRRTTSSSADGPSRNSAASSSGSSASSASSLQSMPPGPLTTASSGFVVSGSSSGGKLALPVGERPAGVEVREHLRQRLQPPRAWPPRPTWPPSATRSSRRSTWSRVGDEQLEPQRLEVVVGGRALREAVERRRGSRRPGGGSRGAAARCRGRRPTRIAAGVTFFALDESRRAGRGGRRRSSPCRRSACRSPTRTR